MNQVHGFGKLNLLNFAAFPQPELMSFGLRRSILLRYDCVKIGQRLSGVGLQSKTANSFASVVEVSPQCEPAHFLEPARVAVLPSALILMAAADGDRSLLT